MKNVKILSAILTTALVLTLTFASCGGGGGGGGSGNTPADNSGGTGGSGGNKNPASKIFESSDEKAIYILEVTSASAVNASVSRAAAPVYEPKTGDIFTLTIILKDTGETWTDSGTVTTSGTTLTLSGEKASSLTITVSSNFKEMIKIEVPSGTTIKVGDTTITIGPSLTPTQLADPSTITLVANYTPEGGNWACGWILSTITKVTPKEGLKYKFKISGTTDKTLIKANLAILAHKDYDDYQWLGGSEQVRLSGTFEETFLISIIQNPKIGHTIQVNLSNEDAVPANAKLNETVLATIKNFELRFIGIEE